MRLVFLADTHMGHNKVQVPPCDILFHSGDFTGNGYPHEVKSFLDWFRKQPAKNKVYCAGNHDRSYENNPVYKNEVVKEYGDIYYLEDSSVTIEGLKIYGSPWQPEFCNWAFNLPRDGKELRDKWAAIPEDTNILLTHGPCYQILDTVIGRWEHLGCKLLADRAMKLKSLKIHSAGHIHSSFNTYQYPDGPLFINASQCDERNIIYYKPVVIDL